MLRKQISLILLIFFYNIFISKLMAEDTRKNIVAVPEFIAGEDVAETLASSLAGVLKSEFDNSGRVLTKSPDDIRTVLDEAGTQNGDNLNLEPGCQFNEECIAQLGREMQVDYITISRIFRVSGWFLIEVRTISTAGKIVIPAILKGVQSEGEIPDAVRSIGAGIAMRFPLEGSILAILQNGKSVIINLGAVNNLKNNDEFFVMRETVVEGFKDRRTVGTVSVIEIQGERSKAEVKSGRGDIQKGDFVILNQDEAVRKLEDERLTDEAKLAELKQLDEQRRMKKLEARLLSDEARTRTQAFARSASLIRIGGSGFGLLKLGEAGLNDYYPGGFGILADILFYRIRKKRSGNGFDFLFRYSYRQFDMTDGSYGDFKDNYPALEYGKSSLNIHSFDLGGRLVLGGYLLFFRIDFYILGALRQAKVIESADNGVRNSYLPLGITGGAGIEFSFYKRFAFFAEYDYGYTTVGENRENIDGHQVYVGVSLRTDYF
jgi:hypothetical protein